ncbi:MAG: hypothetical protein NVSMB57_02170 [Actinomycetota bacterium]
MGYTNSNIDGGYGEGQVRATMNSAAKSPDPGDEHRVSLPSFSLADMLDCAARMRDMGGNCYSMEDVAQSLCSWLFKHFTDGHGGPAFRLVRLYKSHPYHALPHDLQGFASTAAGIAEPDSMLRCLCLLGSVGSLPAWNDRRYSSGHKAIPLVSEEVVARSPMIAQLFTQMGVSVGTAIAPDPKIVLDLQEKSFNVFHVEDAVGSPLIPAQEEFVVPHNVRSAIGFGGVLPTGDLFAMVMFSTIPVKRDVAQLFRSLALSAKLALLPFTHGPTFNGDAA